MKDKDLDPLLIKENASDQNIVVDMTLTGYSFHHEAQLVLKAVEVCILLGYSLKFEGHLNFLIMSFKISTDFCIWRINVRVANLC